MTIADKKREQVKIRANNRCEYCLLLEAISSHTFHVDHIIAIKHNGTDDLDNLAWSCLNCNLHKGSDIASYDSQSKLLTPLFNPRIDKWSDNFELHTNVIEGKSAIGRVTVRILQMNNPQHLAMRQQLIDTGLW